MTHFEKPTVHGDACAIIETDTETISRCQTAYMEHDRWWTGEFHRSTLSQSMAEIREHFTAGKATEEQLADFARMRALFDPVVDLIARSSSVSRRMRRRWSDDGCGDLDVDRYLASDPACWVRTVRGRPNRLVRLGLHLSQSAGNGPDAFTRTAAAAAAAADCLQAAGLGVEVVGFKTTVRRSERIQRGELKTRSVPASLLKALKADVRETVIAFPLRRAGDPLDVQRILAAGTSAVSRCLLFGTMQRAFGYRDNYTVQTPALDPLPTTIDALRIDYVFGHTWGSRDGKQAFRFADFLKRALDVEISPQALGALS